MSAHLTSKMIHCLLYPYVYGILKVIFVQIKSHIEVHSSFIQFEKFKQKRHSNMPLLTAIFFPSFNYEEKFFNVLTCVVPKKFQGQAPRPPFARNLVTPLLSRCAVPVKVAAQSLSLISKLPENTLTKIFIFFVCQLLLL